MYLINDGLKINLNIWKWKVTANYSEVFNKCVKSWAERKYVPCFLLYELAEESTLEGDYKSIFFNFFKAFNCSDTSIFAIKKKVDEGDFYAKEAQQYILDNQLDRVPYEVISGEKFEALRKKLFINPEKFMTEDLNTSYYPYYSPGKTYGYKPQWVNSILKKSRQLFVEFSNSRGSDIAILVGNGPSLNKVDFDLFCGQDVYVSNYAIKNKTIAQYAKGVAVTNHLVAAQEPYWFQLNSIWKFHPLWLSYTLPPTETSILLNALGGELFFSKDVTSKVAWHSTVTFFWLQILYSAGYKKIVMVGFDHYYHQEKSAKEGDLIKQTADDENHFDPNYFKGKIWQAADTKKMEATYMLAKQFYEDDGREIVNATVGGHLEVFRRSELSKEIAPRNINNYENYRHIVRPSNRPKIAIITAFWKGDVEQAELHWRLINRLGVPSVDHIYLFKHNVALLQPNTLPRVVCADVENNYYQASQKPHPAGPNLVFVHTVKMLLETQYTHFFWLEPDCIPTSKSWLEPFIKRLDEYPEEAIIGTGGGTISPGQLHWRNHFAGCSLYNLKHLSEIGWDQFINDELHVSFDVWLAVNLGYIKLGEVNNNDQSSTIIYGKDRFDWSLVRKPKSLVYGMFEHWRPEKILSAEQLEERLTWSGFSLYHAIKDKDIVNRLYKRLPKSASTIIINYNNENYLFDAITSALTQKIRNIQYEVIVVDDGSTDSSKNIINSFGSKIKTIFLKHGILNGNFNQQRALKNALKIASGEVILLLDGDDVFYENKVQKVCEMFDDPDVILGQHTLEFIDERSSLLSGVFEAFPKEQIKPSLYKKLARVNLFQATSALAFRRSYLLSQLHHLNVDDYTNTWLDVRLTRFSPYHGKIYSSRNKLGAWRRHANSDSIRTDNIAERVQKHEMWYCQVADKMGFPNIPFKWKKIIKSAIGKGSFVTPLLGPFKRDDHAHWDETLGVRRYTSSNKSGVMIDVGAHEGYALMPFLNDGWKVFAFEPDNVNRSKLLERLAKHKNKDLVSLDIRCVSNKSKKNISFYRSEQSTGISGLSAFHETHVKAQSTDIVTLTDFFSNKELLQLDFLKIDTEGHDLFVLQGFPWECVKPEIIECEFEDAKTVSLGYNFHDLAGFLVEKGYTVYVSEWHPIIRYGIQHDWKQLVKYPCDLSNEKAWGNLLAFHDSVDERELKEVVKNVLKVRKVENNLELGIRFKKMIPDSHYTRLSNDLWQYKHSDAKQKLWLAIFDVSPTAEHRYVSRITLKSDKEMTVSITIGRHGTSEYEGSSEHVRLFPNKVQTIKIYHTFGKNHSMLKLQLDIIELKGKSLANIKISSYSMNETFDSVKKSINNSRLNLSQANCLFRDGDYLTSMILYLLLGENSSLGVYDENTLMAARKLGLKTMKVDKKLLQYLN